MSNKKFKNYNGGEMPFGLQVIIFLIIIFVIWILTGGTRYGEDSTPLIKPVYEEAVSYPLR
ncbi:MAG: hypothetical protein O210_OD1C00001G0619 [Parcubacteria bacterium RAAC4_OD1_1]|nr:MAG: hypothetical protein O210_OD1C00001G0619 [Parcubacteria bacterium RAAC4_OD1_1]